MTWRSESTSSGRKAGLQTMSQRMSKAASKSDRRTRTENTVWSRSRERRRSLPDGVDDLGDLASRPLGGSLEEQVFEEMGSAGQMVGLVPRSHAHPIARATDATAGMASVTTVNPG